MRFFTFLLFVCFVGGSLLWAQEEESTPLSISGSVDTYYKWDFGQTSGNIPTSFAGDHNSLSIGMVDLVFEKKTGKASFLAELAMGPRNINSAGPTTSATSLPGEFAGVSINDYQPRIQNLYVAYDVTDQITLTGGYMGTFVGYEIISPTGNFNYSTSYMFTNGPFQNAGLKADFSITDQLGVMVGVFNPWNVYSAGDIGLTSFGAQLYVSPVEGWDAYVNFVTGGESGTEADLTTTYQITDDFMLGVNAAFYTDGAEGDSAATFNGAALYANYSLTKSAAIGLRYENFNNSGMFDALGLGEDASVNAITLSLNLTSGNLTLIPEVRVDLASGDAFADADGNATSQAVQALVAAVYSF